MNRPKPEPIFRCVLNTETETPATPVAGTGPEQVSEALGPPIRPLIDGRPTGGSTLVTPLIEPATGQPFAQICFATPEDVDHAADSAARTSALWRGTPYRERGRSLRRLAAVIYDESRSIARLISREQGKPYTEALALEGSATSSTKRLVATINITSNGISIFCPVLSVR